MLQDFKLTENIEEAVDVAQEQPLPQHCHRLKPHQLRTIQIALQDESKRVENETVDQIMKATTARPHLMIEFTSSRR